MRARQVLGSVLAVVWMVTVGACAMGAPVPLAAPGSSVEASATAAPVGVSIPSIGADSSLEPMGLNLDGTMAVPPVDEPWQASWFTGGVAPGETGPAVVAGHVSGRSGDQSVPGVFARLAELAPGDDVWIDRSDGTRLRFAVDRVETHDKDEFPTVEVYGDTAGPELRLVTCGGDLQDTPDGRSYDANVVAYAVLVETVAP